MSTDIRYTRRYRVTLSNKSGSIEFNLPKDQKKETAARAVLILLGLVFRSLQIVYASRISTD